MPKTDSPNSHSPNSHSPSSHSPSSHSSKTTSVQTDGATSNRGTSNRGTSDGATPPVSLKDFSAQELAEALAQKLAITPNDWHRLSANRSVRAREQAAAALVYMLKDKPEEALPRLNQSIGWLNKTLKAPPCPTHGEKRTQSQKDEPT